MDVLEALKVLGLKPGCNMIDIKSKRNKLAMEYHPDRNPNDKVALEKMKKINIAYQVCNDFKYSPKRYRQNHQEQRRYRQPQPSGNQQWVEYSFDLSGFRINIDNIKIDISRLKNLW